MERFKQILVKNTVAHMEKFPDEYDVMTEEELTKELEDDLVFKDQFDSIWKSVQEWVKEQKG